MPWVARGKCVYKKDTGKKVGCTKGSVKKYLAALHINAHEESKKVKKDYKNFKDYYENMVGNTYAPNMPGMNGDQTGVQEAEYADAQDDTQSTGPLDEQSNKRQIIQDIIGDLEDLRDNHDWNKTINNDLIRAMAQSLEEVGIEPTDFYASVDATPDKQEQYLITGPSSWKGGNGALRDLINILKGNEPQEIKEDEPNPASDLPMGTTSAQDPLSENLYRIGELIFNNPYGSGRMHFRGIDSIEAKSEDHALNKYVRRLAVQKKIPTDPRILYTNAKDNGVVVTKIEQPVKKEPTYWWQDFDENFMDHKGPGRPGDSRRHGIPKKATMSQLRKAAKAKGRKGQLARWQINMRRGKAKHH